MKAHCYYHDQLVAKKIDFIKPDGTLNYPCLGSFSKVFMVPLVTNLNKIRVTLMLVTSVTSVTNIIIRQNMILVTDI